MAFVCPYCNKIVHYMPFSGDIIHECNTGDEAIDDEDKVTISGVGWNYQGAINTVDVISRIRGDDDEPLTAHGNRKSTHLTRTKERYFKID